MDDSIHRLTAFSTDPEGGNPAGVWVGESLPTDQEMLAVAAEVGYSETVFATLGDDQTLEVRYFSPEAEVPFCGHATIALGVHLGHTVGEGTYQLDTQVGRVPVAVSTAGGEWSATLTSVEPTSEPAPPELVDGALDALGWSEAVLAPSHPPVVAFAGARHLILTLLDRATLGRAEYEFEQMKTLMLSFDLTTVDLVWHESDTVVHSRNLFAVGGVVEDPATGAAAAAFVGHLRSAGLIAIINVHAPATGGIQVSGAAVYLAVAKP